MPAPTFSKPMASAPGAAPAQSGTRPAPQLIPFTRAARKKSRNIGTYQTTLTTSLANFPPIQVPANGFIRRLVLDITLASAGNSVTGVTFANDAPYNVLQALTLAGANGDSIISSIDGFTLAMLQKYGCFSNDGAYDPLSDPTFTKVEGSGATAGSAHFQINVPFELDERDGLGSLPNMAANQSYLLQFFGNTLAQVYSVAPTAAPTLSIQITAEYWSAPAAANSQQIPQEQNPRNYKTVSLIQTQQPTIVANTDQVVQLVNVGNTVRFLLFILRDGSGVRTAVDWPNVTQLLVNNDIWLYKTKANWLRQIAQNYGLRSGVAPAAKPTLNTLDAGVYVLCDFIDSGSAGDAKSSGASNRDLMLVTGSGTALNIEAQNWGASAVQLNVVTNALRVASPEAFYAPFGV